MSLLSSGTLNRISPQGFVALDGILLEIAIAALLMSAGSIRLFTNGARSAICLPALHSGAAYAVKSPASIASVGTQEMNEAGT